MLERVLLIAVASVVLTAHVAWADGTVTRARGCGDKIFVNNNEAYSILTATGGDPPADGDQLVGDVNRIGHTVLFDKETGRSISAIVEDRGLNKAEITQRMTTNCRSLLASSFTSGRVERAIGCGNKFFVNTPQGYALLERLAGGIVNEGDDVQGDFNKAGRATIQNRQSGATLTVFVDDYRLSSSAASHAMARKCRPK